MRASVVEGNRDKVTKLEPEWRKFWRNWQLESVCRNLRSQGFFGAFFSWMLGL